MEHREAIFAPSIAYLDDFGRFIRVFVSAGFVKHADHPNQAHLLGLPGCAGLIEQFAGKGHFFFFFLVFHQVGGLVGEVASIPFGLD
ncbi:MAG: hypothetical protein KDE45_04645 [Caldilineaceae bacterium]|nr:hypothetical protein [Caldilineaceae bacterium]